MLRVGFVGPLSARASTGSSVPRSRMARRSPTCTVTRATLIADDIGRMARGEPALNRLSTR
jgi:hypothetical protein